MSEDRRLVLVVEDSVTAIHRFRQALSQAKVEYEVISRISAVNSEGIKGVALDHPSEQVAVEWSQVAVLFCDYQLPGALMGDAAMKAAQRAGVPVRIAMSSASHFNQRLKEAGATKFHLKPVALGGLETGAFAAVLPAPPIPKKPEGQENPEQS